MSHRKLLSLISLTCLLLAAGVSLIENIIQSDFRPDAPYLLTEADKLKTYSENEILDYTVNLAKGDGYFEGTTKQNHSLNGDLVTTIRKTNVQDDSIGPYEIRLTSKKIHSGQYQITEIARRGSCSRYSSFRDTILSVFFNPLFTDRPCS